MQFTVFVLSREMERRLSEVYNVPPFLLLYLLTAPLNKRMIDALCLDNTCFKLVVW